MLIEFELYHLGPDKSQHPLVTGMSNGRFRHAIKYCLKIAFSNPSEKSAGERGSKRGRAVFKAMLPLPETRL